MHHTCFVAVELHEYVVPNLNETVAIFIWTAWRAAPNVFTVVIKNFGTRAAGACVAHHPEIV